MGSRRMIYIYRLNITGLLKRRTDQHDIGAATVFVWVRV